MKNLKHGDTDVRVTFTFGNDQGPVTLSGKTATVKLVGKATGTSRVITLVNVSPEAAGQAYWEPSDADYAVLVADTYKAEGYTVNGSNKKRHFPTVGVEEIIIEEPL